MMLSLAMYFSLSSFAQINVQQMETGTKQTTIKVVTSTSTPNSTTPSVNVPAAGTVKGAAAQTATKTTSTVVQTATQSTSTAPTVSKVAGTVSSVNDKAKMFTDQISKAVTLTKEQYANVMAANVAFQQKKASILNGAKEKDMTADMKTQLGVAKKERNMALATSMGAELYKQWQTYQSGKGGK